MPDFGRIIRAAYGEILGREPDPSGLAQYNRLMNEGLSEEVMRETLLRSAEFAEEKPIVPTVRVSGGLLLVGTEPLRQFTLFAAGLRDEGTLAGMFQQGRALGYNCARVGSETADWDTDPGTPPPGSRLSVLEGLRGPEPGSPEQIENLNRVVRVAARQQMTLEVCISFTIKERPFQAQLAHVERTAEQLRGEPHVFFTAVNEPWVNSNLSVGQVNRLLRRLQDIAPERLRGVDEDGSASPEFRYDSSICDFIAYHWPRDAGWEQAPGVARAVRRWGDQPVFLNETQCFQSPEEVEKFGGLRLCQTNQEGFVQMMEAIYRQGAFGCFHPIWGIRVEAFGFAPEVGDLGRTESTQSKLRLLAAP